MDTSGSTAPSASFTPRRFFVAWAVWSVLMPFVAGLATVVGTSGRAAPEVAMSLAFLPLTVLGWAMLIPLNAVAAAVTLYGPATCRTGAAALLPTIGVFLAAVAVTLIGFQVLGESVPTSAAVSLVLEALAGGSLFAALLWDRVFGGIRSEPQARDLPSR